MTENQAAAVEVAQLARNMLSGYCTHIAAIRMPPRVNRQAFVRLIGDYLTDVVPRKDGTEWTFDTQDAFFGLADKAIATELPVVWLTGALLAVGDALKRKSYFDHAPELELIYHLRNGIAHGNCFSIDRKRLKEHPAHNHNAACNPNSTSFEITDALDGKPVLFNFMGAGDVLDLLASVGAHLDRIGRGEHPIVCTEVERMRLIALRERLHAKPTGNQG